MIKRECLEQINFSNLLYHFNIGSVYLIFGIPMFLFGFFYGIFEWYYHITNDILAPTGTIMAITVNLILGFQLILQAIQYDISRVNKF